MLRICLNFMLLLYGLKSDAKVQQYKPISDLETAGLNKESHGKDYELNNVRKGQEQVYNPVLKNVSVLFDYLNTEQRRHKRKSTNFRKKRSNRHCSGLCENSLCTWREEWDEERTRIPRYIKYAVCDSPRCNFDFADLDNTVTFALQINTHCDLVKTDMQVTEDGRTKWLTDWPIACICTQRVVDTSSTVQLRHPGTDSHTGQIDVDITNNESRNPVSRQRIVLNAARHRSLSRAQRRRLRNQLRDIQNTESESWEQLMRRKHSNHIVRL